jgi:hypothetical protein
MLFFVKRAYYSLQKSHQTLLATCLATDPRPNGKSGLNGFLRASVGMMALKRLLPTCPQHALREVPELRQTVVDLD